MVEIAASKAEMGLSTGTTDQLATVEVYDQLYSSAIAPSFHLATVTIRSPLWNSPTTQVHSPDPNLIGCE
jgi:hypothetical protein